MAIIATDNTFARATRGDSAAVWQGKCIFCRRKLLVAADGTPISAATVEHIVSRNHGGDDSIENLALACASCNHEKGRRHDNQRKDDPRTQEIVSKLQVERRRRWREPD